MDNLEPFDPRVDMVPQGVRADAGGPDHERGDITLRGIGFFAVSLVGVIALTMIALGLWMGSFVEREQNRQADVPPRFSADDETLFPEPRLQGNPGADMARWRSSEDAILSGYSWVDRDARIARIPIARAMDLTAERLASQAETSSDPTASSEEAGSTSAPGQDATSAGRNTPVGTSELPDVIFQGNPGDGSPDRRD